ncbi:MAG: hypothetical protein KKF89_05030 [Nanoarchaeota archaeon]|nr:hypothetical protein [Nanoarchaeota archaeon]MBU1855058.1 hypothetical protein [Nanoarchaeota archaeon]
MINTYSLLHPTQEVVEKIKRDFPSYKIHIDEIFNCYPEVVESIEAHSEIVSIRFMGGHVRIPRVINGVIPLFIKKPNDPIFHQFYGIAHIPMLYVAHVPDFEERIAVLDYNSKEKMLFSIGNIYNHELVSRDVLSGYFVPEIKKII